jgi:hypothetical protein
VDKHRQIADQTPDIDLRFDTEQENIELEVVVHSTKTHILDLDS